MESILFVPEGGIKKNVLMIEEILFHLIIHMMNGL